MKTIDKEFVPHEQSLELKELGFDEPCFGFYIAGHLMVTTDSVYNSTDIPVLKAPTLSQAFRFFREKYPELDFGVGKIHNGTNNYHYHINLQWEFFEGTYEEAELACLKKLIEIVKNKLK